MPVAKIFEAQRFLVDLGIDHGIEQTLDVRRLGVENGFISGDELFVGRVDCDSKRLPHRSTRASGKFVGTPTFGGFK
jgi:hypothetical protein